MISLYKTAIEKLDVTGDVALPTLARFTFAATLAGYFWASALTKVDGLSLTINAYAQIFPKAMEAANYDASALGPFHAAVVWAGTLAEFVLPALLILGFLTRPVALGMIGFVAVQTLTDLYGHGGAGHPETLGAWFDRFPDALIMDQRLFWVALLAVPLFKGAGPLSLDAVLGRIDPRFKATPPAPSHPSQV